jgi:hypothetical protein
MDLFWLVFQHETTVCVVIQPAHSLIAARLRVAVAHDLIESFREGHELDPKTAKKVPKNYVGKPLSATQAKNLLAKLA